MATVEQTTELAPLAGKEIHDDVTRFLTLEAELLDNRRFTEWAEILADDFEYLVPLTLTRDDPARLPYSDESFLIEESKSSLEGLWLRRYEESRYEFAWGENPPQRTRHFITNVRVREAGDGSYQVRSNLLFSFARQSDPLILVSGERADTIRENGDGLLLARRVVYLDQSVQTLTHLRQIF
jgi:3-phenylpropionate/cinnamic acid dioxygenase small subunit